MLGKRKDFFPPSKVMINPSYEWDEDAKKLNISHRELEVFALLMDGRNNKEISQILGIQYQSVKNHTSSLYKKLKAKNMAQATKLLLIGNFIKTEVPGVDWLKFDKESWIKHMKWVLDPKSDATKEQKEEMKKFVYEFGLLQKVYEERLKELQVEEEKE